MNLQNVLTVKEASDFCMVSPETVRRWIKMKLIRAYNTEGPGVMKIRLEDLRSFARQHNMLTSEDN
jgi:excisionase family DNA binding protein